MVHMVETLRDLISIKTKNQYFDRNGKIFRSNNENIKNG